MLVQKMKAANNGKKHKTKRNKDMKNDAVHLFAQPRLGNDLS